MKQFPAGVLSRLVLPYLVRTIIGIRTVVTVMRISVTLLMLSVNETLNDLTYGAEAMNRNGLASRVLNRSVTVTMSMSAVTSKFRVIRPVSLGEPPGNSVIIMVLTVGISSRTSN